MNFNLSEGWLVFKRKYASNILFWIILFFVIRLFNITAPPIEAAHNWRQAFTNIVARNFLQVDNNIFFPRAIIFGNNPGVVGTEFPFLNYLIYLMSELFGYAHWYGRLINLIISSFGVYYFYKIVFRFINPQIAFNATIILICSIWFVFSRKSMPDTFSISILLIGLYYGLLYLNSSSVKHLWFYFVFFTVGILCKIPGVYLLGIFIVPILNSEINIKTKLLFILFTIPGLVIIFCWYFQWVPQLDSMYGNRLYFPRSLSVGFAEIMEKLNLTAEKFYFSSFQGFIGFAVFLAGIAMMVIHKAGKAILVFLLITFVFFLFILKTGFVFPLHSYYVIPYTPVMCVIVAYSLNFLKNKKIQVFILLLIAGEGIANQQNDFFIKEEYLYKIGLESIADKVSGKEDLIAVNGGESPQLIYFANRGGWRLTNEEMNDVVFMQSIIEKDCKFLFIDKHLLIEPQLSQEFAERIYDDANFSVYRLLKR